MCFYEGKKQNVAVKNTRQTHAFHIRPVFWSKTSAFSMFSHENKDFQVCSLDNDCRASREYKYLSVHILQFSNIGQISYHIF